MKTFIHILVTQLFLDIVYIFFYPILYISMFFIIMALLVTNPIIACILIYVMYRMISNSDNKSNVVSKVDIQNQKLQRISSKEYNTLLNAPIPKKIEDKTIHKDIDPDKEFNTITGNILTAIIVIITLVIYTMNT